MDSEFLAVDSRSYAMDSGSLVISGLGFGISIVSRIRIPRTESVLDSNAQCPGFTRGKNFPDSGIQITLTWGDRALHRYQGFESRNSLKFFEAFFSQLQRCFFNCRLHCLSHRPNIIITIIILFVRFIHLLVFVKLSYYISTISFS